ncbi:MAG TPA: DUF4382 domain-containing protein [Phnomibacter sp.]|nr:DUF4382 domain-containing protein [Phnomibacter sp.]
MQFPKYLLVLILVAGLVSCQKTDVDRDVQLRVYMTDPNLVASSLSVEIQGVKVKYKGTVEDSASNNIGHSDGWVWLDTKAGVYDLLELTSGKKALLAIGSIPGGQVKELRLVLGNNNSFSEGGKSIPVKIPAGSELGFKIPIVKQLAPPRDSLTIHFDAYYSIAKTSSESYTLVPSLQIK